MKPTPKVFGTFILFLTLASAGAAQRVKHPIVNLNVAVDDLVSQVSGVRSDDPDNDPSTLTVYSHGVDSVSAQLGENGYFAFRSGTRSVRAVYSSPVDGSGLPAEDFRQNVEFLTFVGDGALQTMQVGTSRCQGFGVNIMLGDAAATRRTIGYRAGRGTLTNTGYVKVSRPDADTWVIESDTLGACPNGANESVARIRDARTKGKTVPDVDHGRYTMPVRLILTRR